MCTSVTVAADCSSTDCTAECVTAEYVTAECVTAEGAPLYPHCTRQALNQIEKVTAHAVNIVMQLGLTSTDVEECLVKRTIRKYELTQLLELHDWVIPVGGITKLPVTLVGCMVKIPSQIQTAVDRCAKRVFLPVFLRDVSDFGVIKI